MNTENFERWLEEQILPNLEELLLSVLDNATVYHFELIEKILNPSWSKRLLTE